MPHPYAHLYVWSDPSLALAEDLRRKLEAAGFTESRWSKEGRYYDPRNHLRFFRQDTELTACFVNLEPSKEGLWVRYGFDSTAFTRMKGDEESLLNWGLCPEDACLRWAVHITTAEDPVAAEQIAAHFRKYQGTGKDDLLNVRKALRKEFLTKIHTHLKPHGFRKKGAEWRKLLPGGHVLYLWADKGSFSDTYDFDVALSAPSGENSPGDYCLRRTLALPVEKQPNPFMHHPFDWQVNTDGDLQELLDRFLKEYHEPLFNGTAAALPLLCRHRECPMERCPLRTTGFEPTAS